MWIFHKVRISTFFKTNLTKSIKDLPFFAASFDESLDRIYQDEQMSVHIHYCSNEKSPVKIKYLDSNADNLHDSLHNVLQSLPEKKHATIVYGWVKYQLEVFELLFSYRNEKEWSNLLNLGSCGLHIVHGAFQNGIKAINWELERELKAMFKLYMIVLLVEIYKSR